MLRTTFHVDPDTDDMAKSYMAVHDDSSVQEVEVIVDETKLHAALRRPFQLSSQFPVRWVIRMELACAGGGAVLRNSYSVFAVGHHIAVDGTSMSLLSNELMKALEPEAVDAASPKHHLSRPQYGDYIHRQASSASQVIHARTY